MPPDSCQPDSACLRVETHSWWRSGTGAGRAAQLDALCVRDRDELPYLPGRHLRGLLRDAVRRLGEWEPTRFAGAEKALFGDWGFNPPEKAEASADTDPVPYRGARHGALAFTDALMPDLERAAFRADAASAGNGCDPLRNEIFSTLHSTAIRNGVADLHSLRAEEVAMPVTLEGEISFVGYDTGLDCSVPWIEVLQAAAPLIRAVGAKRHRGLGRAAVYIDARPS